MWRRFTKLIGRGFDKKIDATGLGLFRIAYSAVLFMEVIQLYRFRSLIFDPIPFIKPSDVDFGYGLICWAICILFLGLGYYTRVSAIINYLFTLTFLGTITTYEYHMFYVYIGTNALMIFMPLHKSISVDRLREKLRHSTLKEDYIPIQKTTVLSYMIPILIGVAFVYSDSILYKLNSPMWLSGLGMWLPANLPMITWMDSSWLMNQRWLILAGGYATLVFELVFIFLFWFRSCRAILWFIGTLLHIGILIEFPIPWFGLGVTAIYLLLVPVHWWKKIPLRYHTQRLRFFYDAECPLCLRTRLILSHFDFRGGISFEPLQEQRTTEPLLRNISEQDLFSDVYGFTTKGTLVKGLDTYIQAFIAMGYTWPIAITLRLPGLNNIARKTYGIIAQQRSTERCTEESCPLPNTKDSPQPTVKLFHNVSLRDIQVQLIALGLAFAILLELAVSYHSALPVIWRQKSGLNHTLIGNALHKTTKTIRGYSHDLLGITNHPVFMDSHFNDYNHIIAITHTAEDGTETFLRMIDDNGQPGNYLRGFVWVKWNWRVNGAKINPRKLDEGIQNFTAFWAHENNIYLTKARFNIKVKKIEIPTGWHNYFLKDQVAQPWMDGGYVEWRRNSFVSHIKAIEKM